MAAQGLKVSVLTCLLIWGHYTNTLLQYQVIVDGTQIGLSGTSASTPVSLIFPTLVRVTPTAAT